MKFVKIFYSDSPNRVNEEITAWIKTENIEVLSATGSTNKYDNMMITIMYQYITTL